MDRADTIKLAIKSLLEVQHFDQVVQTGAKNIEIAVMDNGVISELEPSEIEKISLEIEKENQEQVIDFNLGRQEETNSKIIKC